MLQKVFKFLKSNPWILNSVTKLNGKKRKAAKRRNEETERRVNVMWEKFNKE